MTFITKEDLRAVMSDKDITELLDSGSEEESDAILLVKHVKVNLWKRR